MTKAPLTAEPVFCPPTPEQLSLCDREPIHIPGSIQPHGLLFVADPDGLAVHHAAGDVEGRLGIPDWEGAALGALVGEAVAARVAEHASNGAGVAFVGQIRAGAELLDASAHRSGRWVIVELEPSVAELTPGPVMLDWLHQAGSAFEQAASLEALCDVAAATFRQITGFDRVMVYRFLEDDAGRVVAEARREGLHSFLNHHFPASDIPRQARALYVRNVTRTIPDVAYHPAPLRPAWTGAEALDLSDSVLRSVSPIHLQYLANMGVAASASISVVRDGVLWGLIACHHETPRLMPYDVRVACRALGGGLARQIKAKEEAESYRQRIRLRNAEDEIVALLSRDGKLHEALSHHLGEIQRMLDADGVAVLRGQELVIGGIHPGAEATRALAAWLLARPGDPVWSTARLEEAHAEGAGLRETASGVLSVVLSPEEPWQIIWFRAEQVETVKWAGNPHKPSADPAAALTPRASFEAWQQLVRGRARRWTVPELDAARRLRQALLNVQQSGRVRELNRRLTDLLRDKDQLLEQKNFLIGEVNHRVQNSLQLVSSFLSMQARTAESPDARATLEEARRRLGAVALVHKRLYRGEQVQVLDAARYVEELCNETIASMGAEWAERLTLDLAPVMITTDRAMTLGLVVTEWLININKYAYGGAPGPIAVTLVEDRASFILTVADRGMGRSSARKGFGSRLIEGMVGQLRGALEYEDNRPGLRAVLRAPMAQ